jgi:hypothetical protein
MEDKCTATVMRETTETRQSRGQVVPPGCARFRPRHLLGVHLLKQECQKKEQEQEQILIVVIQSYIKKMKCVSHLILVPTLLEAIRLGRSRAGDVSARDTCVPCRYKGMHEFCLPQENLPLPGDWVCNNPTTIQDDAMWACLMAGSDKASCEQDTTCVWCAEPVFGLCVPPNAASQMKYLPFFKCDIGAMSDVE